VHIRPVNYNPQEFSSAEFYKVLSATSYENGYDKKERRNRYRDWLPTTFKLGAFSCLRLDELVHMKYKDIVNIDGIWVLESMNRKANKLIDNKNKRRIKRIPVIPELYQILFDECDFGNKKGKDEYIIAPKLGRLTVKSIISKGFTHYKRIAGIEENKCFKELRTTYISKHRAEFGDLGLTATISDHSNLKVVDKHYNAQTDAVKKSVNLKIFPDHEVRAN
jgi:integrase